MPGSLTTTPPTHLSISEYRIAIECKASFYNEYHYRMMHRLPTFILYEHYKNIDMSDLSLTVVTSFGQKKTLSCPSSAPVTQLKTLISEWQATDPTNVIIMLRGRSLDDDSSLSSEGLKDGSKLNVVVKGAKLERMHSMPLPNIPEPQPPKTNNTPSLPRADTMPEVPTGSNSKPTGLRPVVTGTSLQRPPAARIQLPSESARPFGLIPKEPHGEREKPAVASASSGVMAKTGNNARPKGPPNQPGRPVPAGISKVSVPNSPGSISSASLSQLTDMGFSESEARAALERVNGDVTKAINLLMGEPAEENNLEAIQKQIREHPEMLEVYIENLKQSPQALQAEQREPGFIRRLLTGGSNIGMERDAGPLNQADLSAIKEIKGMGFTDQQAKEAYLAAGRNIEVALNALLG